MSTKRIASAFRFDEQELNANREGKLSAAQRLTLRAQRNASLTLLVLTLVPFIALVTTASASLVCMSGLFAVVALRELLRAVRLQRDLRAERITATFGRIHLRVQNKRRSELLLETEAGLRHLRVSTEQMLALRDGEYYMTYLAPMSDTILSIEPAHVGRADEDTGHDTVDLSALAEEESEVEKPKRDVYVLGDDGELELRRES